MEGNNQEHGSFECSECNYKTFSESEIIDHSVTHRNTDDDNTFSECDYKTFCASQLIGHGVKINLSDSLSTRQKFFKSAQHKDEGVTNEKQTQYNRDHKRECKFCGRKHKFIKKLCPAWGSTCSKCGKMNHFKIKCNSMAKPNKKKSIYKVNCQSEDEESDSEYETIMKVEGQDETNGEKQSSIKSNGFPEISECKTAINIKEEPLKDVDIEENNSGCQTNIVYIKEEPLSEWDIQESKHFNKKIKLEDVGNYQSVLETNQNETKNRNNKYDYCVCTVCHIRIVSRDDNHDIQFHCQMFSHETVSNVIVGVKLGNVRGKPKLLHCCDMCTFACSKYMDIIKHLRSHTAQEVNTMDRTKYSMRKNIASKILNMDSMNHTCHLGGMHKQRRNKVDIDIDNKGKYIPLGWQRKVYMRKTYSSKSLVNKSRLGYNVAYISPFGNLLLSYKEVSDHIDYLKENGIALSVNVEEMDFSTLSDDLPEIKKK